MEEIRRAIVAEGNSQIVIERSRFVGYALPARSPEEAETALGRLRAEHPQATHHCYAWRCGPGQERQSDDGEPQATAGLPLLEGLRRREVDYGLLVVVRYYGGKKLGRPGLYRAYLDAGVQALDTAEIMWLVPGSRYRVQVAHQSRVALQRAVESLGGEVLATVYGAQVDVEYWLPHDVDLDALVRRCDAAGRSERLSDEVRGRSETEQGGGPA